MYIDDEIFAIDRGQSKDWMRRGRDQLWIDKKTDALASINYSKLELLLSIDSRPL